MPESSNLSVVFVHLGTTSPRHLFKNLALFVELFPGQNMVFIGDSDLNLTKARKLGVAAFKYERGLAGHEAMPELAMPFDFRHGFWHFTLERLYAIGQWHSQNPDTGILHLESDLLLMADFPFDKFSDLRKCAWPSVNENTDMAGILFSPSWESTQMLLSRISAELRSNPNLNDMTVLNEIYKKFGSDIHILPTWSSDWPSTNVPPKFSVLESYFGGIFDAASMGTWLTGQDPRNHWGIIRRFEVFSDYLLNFSKFRFIAGPDLTITAEKNSTRVVVFNLHVHSKELKYFDFKKAPKSLERAARRNESQRFTNSFKLGGFVYVIRGYAKVLFSRRGIPAIITKVKTWL